MGIYSCDITLRLFSWFFCWYGTFWRPCHCCVWKFAQGDHYAWMPLIHYSFLWVTGFLFILSRSVLPYYHFDFSFTSIGMKHFVWWKHKPLQRKQKTSKKRFLGFFLSVYILLSSHSLSIWKELSNPLSTFFILIMKRISTFKMLNVCLVVLIWHFCFQEIQDLISSGCTQWRYKLG